MGAINTFGLGGDATNMILNRFNLGGFGVIVIVEPVEPPSTGGGGGVIYRPPEREKYKKVTFIISRDGQTWRRSYLMTTDIANIIIRVTKVINRVIKSIKFGISNVYAKFKTFRIKR